jgi:type II secretory pathway component PulF
MPAYRYDALDADGKAAKGLVEADSAKAARSAVAHAGRWCRWP